MSATEERLELKGFSEPQLVHRLAAEEPAALARDA